MSTSDRYSFRRVGAAVGPSWGFSVVELLLGLTLALCVAAAAAPLWHSLESRGVREGDQTIRLLQARVAASRFENDLRVASAGGSTFCVSMPILEASASEIVFLERSAADAVPVLVEWEIVNGTLMRRRGVCPAAMPVAYTHSLFVDHKTMLEGVKPGSAFAYLAAGRLADPTTEAVDLTSIDGVELSLKVAADHAGPTTSMTVRGRVGR